jgi:hypothetical protein
MGGNKMTIKTVKIDNRTWNITLNGIEIGVVKKRPSYGRLARKVYLDNQYIGIADNLKEACEWVKERLESKEENK